MRMIRSLLALALLVPALASADYVSTVLADSPCALWKMNEASGNIVNYGSTSGNLNGVAHGGLTYAQPGGVTGYNSILFDGSTGYLDWSWGSGGAPATCKDMGANGAGTVECWIDTPTLPAGTKVVNSAEDNTGISKTFELDLNQGGKVASFYIFNAPGNAWVNALGSTALVANTWFLTAGTYSSASSGTITANVNGVTEATTTSAGTPGTSIAAAIGANNAGTGNFVGGYIQMCALYMTKLSDATLTAHYNAGTVAAGLPNTGRRSFQSRRTIVSPYFLPVSFGVREPEAFPLDVPTFVIDRLNKRAIRVSGTYVQ